MNWGLARKSLLARIFEAFSLRFQLMRMALTSPKYQEILCEEHQISVQKPVHGESPFQVLITVILPGFYDAEQVLLRKSINSLLAQHYTCWQLLVLTEMNCSQDFFSILNSYEKEDCRINVIRFNVEDAAVYNIALKVVKGEFFILIDQGDELSADALYEVARHIRQCSNTDYIYTDEDEITLRGQRKKPFFKPDWSPEYFQACMYACRLGAYRTSLVREIGGFCNKYGRAQAWELLLRLTEKSNRIHHIPKVLYHKRLLPKTKDAMGCLDFHDHALNPAQEALQAFIQRSPYPGTVEPISGKSGCFKVRRDIQGNPLVSIIIPSAGTRQTIKGKSICLLEQCLDSIRRLSSYQNYEIVLVDGYDIPEDSLKGVRGPELRLVRCDQPFNFSQRMNLGGQAAQGEILLMLNDDTEVITPDWIEVMVGLAQQKQIGAVGAKLFYPNGRLQHAGILILEGTPSHAFHNGVGSYDGYYCSNIVNRNYLGVTGACLMMRQEVFVELNGFDETFPLNYNDVDLCLRAHEAGYRNVYTPDAELIHYESVSRGRGLHPGELEHLHGKFAHTNYMVDDPYYNHYLSVRRPFFQLAWPSERQQRLEQLPKKG